MKLLGQFPKKVANEYKELLLSDGIEVKIEGSANNNPFGQLDSTFDSIFVPEESYEKAVGIIKDFEITNESQLKKDSKEANKALFYILLGVVLVMVLFRIFFKK